MGSAGKIGAALLLFIVAFPMSIVLLFGGGDDDMAVTGGGGFNEAAVPSEYLTHVTRAGSICPEITPDVIAAQIDAESGWNPSAVSHAGAQGISQFMPGTWKHAGKDGDGDGIADPFNPADAIFSQGHMMCGLISQVRILVESGVATGDLVDLALAAYNAGIGRVTSAGGIPNIAETRAYIKKINELRASKYTLLPTAVTNENVAKAIEFAKTQIGKPYRGHASGPGCGSFGPNCWDCCGLVKGAFGAIGLEMPMSIPGESPARRKCEHALLARAAEYGGVEVPATRESLRPGDIMFFQSSKTSPQADYITHVAIYIGNDQLIDATPRWGVSIRNVTWPHGATDKILPTAVRIGKP